MKLTNFATENLAAIFETCRECNGRGTKDVFVSELQNETIISGCFWGMDEFIIHILDNEKRRAEFYLKTGNELRNMGEITVPEHIAIDTPIILSKPEISSIAIMKIIDPE